MNRRTYNFTLINPNNHFLQRIKVFLMSMEVHLHPRLLVFFLVFVVLGLAGCSQDSFSPKSLKLVDSPETIEDDSSGEEDNSGNDNTEEAVWSRYQCIEEPLEVASPSSPPDCNIDGNANSFVNSRGIDRHYCFYNASSLGGPKKPLIIYFHGGLGNAGQMYTSSLLRDKAETFDFENGQGSGYHLVAFDSLQLDSSPIGLPSGKHFDTYWWDLRQKSSNPEIQDIDHLVNLIVQSTSVDTSRIYLIGWSQGGMLAQYYGIARHETPSEHGYKIAAVATYSSPSPFIWGNPTAGSLCQTDLDFSTSVPIYTLFRNCDLSCSKEQQEFFKGVDNRVTYSLPEWQNILIDELGNDNTVFQMIDGNSEPASQCLPPGNGEGMCNYQQALMNHTIWPRSLENQYLEFFKDHQSL